MLFEESRKSVCPADEKSIGFGTLVRRRAEPDENLFCLAV
jgi:hypothetical protein